MMQFLHPRTLNGALWLRNVQRQLWEEIIGYSEGQAETWETCSLMSKFSGQFYFFIFIEKIEIFFLNLSSYLQWGMRMRLGDLEAPVVNSEGFRAEHGCQCSWDHEGIPTATSESRVPNDCDDRSLNSASSWWWRNSSDPGLYQHRRWDENSALIL